MRFLRGLGVAILCFFIWVATSIFAAMELLGEYGLDAEVDLGLVSPIWTIPLVISFFGMFIGPLYYWVIEPIRQRGQTPPQMIYSQGIANIHKFCPDCGMQNINRDRFCSSCGANLVI